MGRAAKLGLAMLAVAALWPLPSGFAQVSTLDLDAAEKPEVRATTLTAGLGVAVLPEFEGSSDYKGAVAPYFQALWQSGAYVQLLGTTLTANVLSGKLWEAGPLLRYRSAREDVENDRVDEMEKVDAAVEVGAFGGVRYQRWSARIEAAQDVSGGHEGFLVTVKAGYLMPLGSSASVGLNASATYASEDYTQTYFGVSRNDAARSGLAKFDAKGGLKDVAAAVLGTYRFTPAWGLLGAVRYTRLVGDAADSPIVDDEGARAQLLTAVLVTYTF